MRRHRVDERDVLGVFREPDVLVLVTRILAQLPAQLAKPVKDACRNGRLRARPVAVELLDDQRRDEQLQLALELQDSQRDDPHLAFSPRGHIKPHGRVDQQAQHGPACYARNLILDFARSLAT
jgi:hypothetical protein